MKKVRFAEPEFETGKRSRLLEEKSDATISVEWLAAVCPGKDPRVYELAREKLAQGGVQKQEQALPVTLEPFLQVMEREVLQTNQGLRSVMAAMSARLEKISFPTNKDAYEFPILDLPEDNPHRNRVRESGIVEDWKRPGHPDFLLSNLDCKVVNLTEFRWDNQARKLSRVEASDSEDASLGVDPMEGGNFVSLVSASGTGKTRCLFEHAYKQFCIYLVTHVDRTDPGIDDLSSFLAAQTRELTEDTKETVRITLRERIIRVILARLAVLRYALTKAPGMEARHWLALQLFPSRYTQYEVFTEAIQAAAPVKLSPDELTVEWARLKTELHCHIQFIAIDEAQYADTIYRKTFENGESSSKRSALSVLVSAISSLPTNIVLSGTGLGIESSIELLVSRAAKHSATAKLVGTTTFFTSSSLENIVRERGYDGEIIEYDLKLFSGRPRFGMRLAEALILKISTGSVAEEITNYFKGLIPRLKVIPAGSPVSSKSVYSELRLAAIEWILHRRGSILRHGEIALERGVCALHKIPESGVDQTAFVIREPLVIRALGDLPKHDFENITNEPPSYIGILFEDYVALNARNVIEGIQRLAKKQMNTHTRFKGPWVLAEPDGSQNIGVSSCNLEETKWLKQILERAGQKGLSVVFPGTSMGADVVIAAKREEDNQKLLVFVQVKSCLKKSTASAMRSLRYPYYQNRDKTPKLPTAHRPAYDALCDITEDPTVSVVHAVIKYPANSKAGSHRVQLNKNGSILSVVFDGSNAKCHLHGMYSGLHALETIKKLDQYRALFMDI